MLHCMHEHVYTINLMGKTWLFCLYGHTYIHTTARRDILFCIIIGQQKICVAWPAAHVGVNWVRKSGKKKLSLYIYSIHGFVFILVACSCLLLDTMACHYHVTTINQ